MLRFLPLLFALGSFCQAQDVQSRKDFRAYSPEYEKRRRECKSRLKPLMKKLVRRERTGRPTAYSKQIYYEVKWLIGSTAQFDRIEKRLNDLKRSLSDEKHPQRVEQSELDGGWRGGTQEWFLVLDATIDRLVSLSIKRRKPKYPLRLLDRINSPEKLTRYLDSLLISDIRREGISHRKELNYSVSALTRLILGRLPTDYRFHPKLEETLLSYLDDKWQNPDTGYWGAWFRRKGKIVKTNDLSITFHIASYRDGKISYWPKIVETTLSMKGREYPHGWLEDGKLSNHHNYDVVKLFRYGWPHVDQRRRQEIAKQMERILDWCLLETITPEGEIKLADCCSLGEAYFFTVSLLDEAGYFNKSRRFWTTREFPKADSLRRKILAHVTKLSATDDYAFHARLKLWAAGLKE